MTGQAGGVPAPQGGPGSCSRSKGVQAMHPGPAVGSAYGAGALAFRCAGRCTALRSRAHAVSTPPSVGHGGGQAPGPASEGDERMTDPGPTVPGTFTGRVTGKADPKWLPLGACTAAGVVSDAAGQPRASGGGCLTQCPAHCLGLLLTECPHDDVMWMR